MNVGEINRKGTQHLRKELSEHLKNEALDGIFINFHQDLFITKPNKRFLLKEDGRKSEGKGEESMAKNSWIDFDYIQNEIDNFLMLEENKNEICGPKHIILFVHKEIRFKKHCREASYKSEEAWDYQVVENLNSLRKAKKSHENHVKMIGKTCEQILKDITLEHNHDLFFSLFFKALENFVFSKDEFKYIQKVLIRDIDQMNRNSQVISEKGGLTRHETSRVVRWTAQYCHQETAQGNQHQMGGSTVRARGTL